MKLKNFFLYKINIIVYPEPENNNNNNKWTQRSGQERSL